MINSLPVEIHSFLLREVEKHGSCDPKHLRPLVERKLSEKALKKLKYTGSVSDFKLKSAVTTAKVVALLSNDPQLNYETVLYELENIGITITPDALESRVARCRDNGLLKDRGTSGKPRKLANHDQTRKGKLQRDLHEAVLSMEKEIPTTLAEARKTIRAFLKGSKQTNVDIDEAIVWAFSRGQLKKAMQAAWDSGYGLQSFRDLTNVKQPPWLVKLVWDTLTGKTEAPNIPPLVLPGIFRIPLSDPSLRKIKPVPKSTYKNPLRLLTNVKGRVRLGIFNGLHFGHVYEGEVIDNPMRKAASACRRRGLHGMVFGGGLFLPDFKRASGSRTRTLESLITGYRLDVEDFPEWYQAKVRQVVQDGLKEPIYIAAEQLLRSLVRGLHKTLISPNGPEFDGPIYVVLSQREQNLIAAIAFFELHYLHVLNVHEAATKLNIIKALGGDEQAIRDATMEKALTTKSNMHQTVERNVLDLATRALIKLVEHDSGIKNLHIIGHNDAYVRFGKGEQIVQFTSMEGGDTLVKYVSEYGPIERKEELPDVVWVFDPAAASYREVVRENKKLENTSATMIAQGPMFVDEELIRRRIDRVDMPKRAHPIVKALKDPYFQPGFCVLNIGGDIPRTVDFISTEQIRINSTLHRIRGDKPKTPSVRHALLRKNEPYFRIVLATDIHMGNSNRYLMERQDGRLIGPTEGYFELVRASGMQNGETPFESIFFLDDLTHGNHFGTHTKIHQERLPVGLLQDAAVEFNKIANSKARRDTMKQALGEAAGLLQMQRLRAGDHELTSQLHAFRRGILMSYLDIFQGVLKRFDSSGAVYKTIGELLGTCDYHSTDIGPIASGSGNHATKTTDGMFLEGISLMDYLRGLLASPNFESLPEEMERLDRLVKGYIFQQEAVGYGRLKIGQMEYGFELNSSPCKMNGWADVLRGVAKAEVFRGNPSGILSGVPVVRFYGDKHFHGFRVGPQDYFVMGAPDTVTDSFAYMAGGLPPTIPGITVMCLPARGLDYAPIMTRFLDAYTIEHWLKKPKKFPWQEWHPAGV